MTNKKNYKEAERAPVFHKKRYLERIAEDEEAEEEIKNYKNEQDEHGSDEIQNIIW